MNILFIMYDQLRWDYMSCAGHPHLHTPNFDRVAAQGVRFTNAFVQSPICGASRACCYTGRYNSSHGGDWNGIPLRVGEMTMGDHLRDAGMDCYVLGKTHMRPDTPGMARLGIDPASPIGHRQAQAGFDTWLRDDGLWAMGPDGYYDPGESPYNAYLKSQGYKAENPWSDYANAGIENGEIASGWMLENADKPANIREQDSETAWLTTQTLNFMQAKHDRPWCAHISYIKPHWPYIVPAPYHNMYGPNQVPAAHRHKCELDDAHPIYAHWAGGAVARAFQRDDVRHKVIPAYMGLIKQCDDHLGRILDHLETTGQMDNTMIVLTSDHGDYLGDHWLGEKDLFHDCSVKVPMIIYDPRPAADKTRGQTCDALVENIDLLPTFVEAAGSPNAANPWLEGRALTPWLHGTPPDEWREYVISEYTYALRPIAQDLGVSDQDARLFMIFDGRYKMMHAQGGFRPQVFDLQTDPDEFHDRGDDPAYADIITGLYDKLAQWGRRSAQRVTKTSDALNAMRGKSLRRGVLPFLVDGSEVPPELTEKYRGPAGHDHI